MRVRKPLFIIESAYERADRERKERRSERNAILMILLLGGAAFMFYQCDNKTETSPPHHDARAEENTELS